MSEHVYRKVELVGSSRNTIEEAVQNALDFAAKEGIGTVRWFEIVETRGYVDHNQVAYWQVTVKVGATAE